MTAPEIRQKADNNKGEEGRYKVENIVMCRDFLLSEKEDKDVISGLCRRIYR